MVPHALFTFLLHMNCTACFFFCAYVLIFARNADLVHLQIYALHVQIKLSNGCCGCILISAIEVQMYSHPLERRRPADTVVF